MYYAVNAISSTLSVGMFSLGLIEPENLPTTSLLFGPIKLIFLVTWIYLCVHTTRHIEASPLIPQKRKAIANVLSLLIGPFLLFVLFIANRATRLQEGDINFGGIIKEAFNTICKSGRRSKLNAGNSIELMDSSGKSFSEIYGNSDKDNDSSREILDLTEGIILDAITEKASDILIDPKGEGIYTIRFRIDGFLTIMDQIETDKCNAIVNSIKAISNMDIAEKRRPQDGSFLAKIPNGDVFFRVASSGVLGGEKLSIRLLNRSGSLLSLTDIGMSKKSYDIINNVIKKPSGMILMCGPTGSGKTTTLYSMLDEIDLFTRNVITVEDPVEYVLPNASQIEINPKADITFAKALRSILRQDPDVICVGEIRDEETAGIALRASQTGHLVLATIHSNSNASALIRLLDLGITSLLLSSGLSIVISQRLLRRLCRYCRVPAELSQNQIHEFHRKNINYKNMLEAQGCKQCNNTGYKGRIAIFDILSLDQKLKTSIANNTLLIEQLRDKGNQRGKSNLQKQALKLVVSGITDIDELKRVIG